MDSISASVKISVIIPVRNQATRLNDLLASLGTGDPPDEVIIVDDGSTEEFHALHSISSKALYRLDKSRGPAYARNLGASKATGEILVFLDSDVICPADFFSAIRSEFSSRRDLEALSFLSQPFDPKAKTPANFTSALEHFWGLKYLEGSAFVLAPVFASRSGAIRRAAFEAIGGFDADYTTNAHEDYDFAKRLADRHQTALISRPLVHHHFDPRFTRLLRNQFVRTALFVSYYIERHPKLDRAQTSAGEACLRILAGSIMAAFTLAIIPGMPYQNAWIGIASSGFLIYLLLMLPFLSKALRWSNSPRFAALCIPLHLVASVNICLGGLYGLACVLGGTSPAGRRRRER